MEVFLINCAEILLYEQFSIHYIAEYHSLNTSSWTVNTTGIKFLK